MVFILGMGVNMYKVVMAESGEEIEVYADNFDVEDGIALFTKNDGEDELFVACFNMSYVERITSSRYGIACL